MFTNTFSQFKTNLKKGVDLLKGITVDTFTAIKNDICQNNQDKKDFKAWKEAGKPKVETPKDPE
jgi:hypothetical protein